MANATITKAITSINVEIAFHRMLRPMHGGRRRQLMKAYDQLCKPASNWQFDGDVLRINSSTYDRNHYRYTVTLYRCDCQGWHELAPCYHVLAFQLLVAAADLEQPHTERTLAALEAYEAAYICKRCGCSLAKPTDYCPACIQARADELFS